jgi:DNA-binding IclR family transcriptional regulator
VSSAARSLQLLSRVARTDAPPSQADLARACGMPKSTVSALLRELQELGYVESVGRGYVVGPSLVSLGIQVGRKASVPPGIRPALQRISAETGETALCAVEVGVTPQRPGGVLHVAQVEGSKALRYCADLGSIRPMHSTAAGRVLLAFSNRSARSLPTSSLVKLTERTIVDPGELDVELERVREQGYAVVVDEHIEGVTAIAAPVVDAAGDRVNTISVAGPTQRIDPEHIWPILRRTIGELNGG